ncbi:ribose-phosphate diphosphokinase [Candidatus Bathyarchaeota archaeon]|nr:ribose-phosphate diphosphokinase [Candidatus Bathyarchaeota archaeon]
MRVIPGPASIELGFEVAKELKSETIPVEFKTFPDGELYLRLTREVAGEKLAIIQTTGPPQNTHLIELLLLIDAAHELGAHSIIAVVPYFAYARQDKRFRPGEPISARTIIKLLEAVGVTRFITINIHSAKILENFNIPAENLSAIPLLAKHFYSQGFAKAFALAPDEGAVDMAIEASKTLGGEYGWLRKERDKITGEIVVEKRLFDIKGRDAIVFDDIISTGGTMATAVKILKEQGARRVYAACVHPLLIGDAKERILKSGAEGIVGTNSVQGPASTVSLAPIIAEALKKEA